MTSLCADGSECLNSMKDGVSFPVECLSAAEGRLCTVELYVYLFSGTRTLSFASCVGTIHVFSRWPLYLFFFSFVGWGWDWVHLVRRPLSILLYQPGMIHECGAVGGMRIGRGNRSTRRKLAPVPLCPPQIPHDLPWARPRAATMGSRRLTAVLCSTQRWLFSFL
jgi:hypothetical protein